MRRIIALLFTAFAINAFVYANPPKKRPNIVIILTDDMGWQDVAFMGSSYYHTPNLDALAKKSMLFTNGYAAAANCAPSRACMLSGLNTPRHGIYTVGEPDRGGEESRKLIPTPNNETLADSIVTFAEALHKVGYATASIGKWHLGKDPRTQGFDINIAGDHRGANGKHFSPYNISTLKDGPVGEFLVDRLTTEAINFIDDKKAQPFLLYLPFYDVHTPLQAPDSLVQKYKGKGTPGQKNSTYAAMVESVDKNVGRILRKLKELHLDENTLVIFTSDNGGVRAVSSQAPLRGGKGSYYEGGIRVPLLIHWPGQIKPGKTDVPVTNMDFYPTFMDILSLPTKGMRFDGASIWPLLQGKTMPDRPLYWHFPIYLQAYDPLKDDGRDPVFRTRPGAVIRQGDWKLHVYYEDNAKELYNLKTDLGERHNVANQHKDITDRLYKQLLAWQKQTNAPVPTQLNPKFKAELQFVSPTKRKGLKKNDE